MDTQKVATSEHYNQTIITTEVEERGEELRLNVSTDDCKIEQPNVISECESPDVNIQ